MEKEVSRPGACQGSLPEQKGGLDHTVSMSDSEHSKFVDAFRIFKEQTDFENEQGILMLKYYVQMAYLEGWKKRSQLSE
jgi:hypothetical protein